ncbi:MAG: hypothetical protein KBT69_15365 [Oceanihabitans sp.]|nr:hypothetical protein [Oceanihabitans sp.]
MDKRKKIQEIVVACLKNFGQEEMISDFESPNEKTKIKEVLDSMDLVVLSVDIEEQYAEVFEKEIKVLNEEEASFMINFKDVETLVEYINKL